MIDTGTKQTKTEHAQHVLCVITFLMIMGVLTGQAGAYTAEYYVNSTGYAGGGAPFVPAAYPINAACNAAVGGARVTVIETGIYNDTVIITSASPTDITLDLGGATLQQASGTALSVADTSGWTVKNGTISGYTTGISLGGTIFDCILEDLTITRTAQDAIYYGTEAAVLTNVIIRDCDIHAPGATGIRNYKSTLDAVIISNVTVDRSGTNGIELADYSSYGRTITGLVLEDVTVTDAGNTGITISETVAESTAPVLTNITVTGATHTGLFVHAIQRMEITNLNVTVCGSTTSDWGLVITGHTADIPVTLDSITVQNCSAGISLNSVANTAITAEDTIRGNGHHQIALANVQNITVEDQQFRADEGAFTHAISIGGTATDIAIRNITVTGATKDAIYCGTEGATLSSVTIEDCDIHAPGATGIRNYRSTLDAVTISNVTVDRSGTNGIELADYSSYGRTITGLVLEDVTVTDAGNTGITISETVAESTAPVLTNITVNGATHTGLFVHAIQRMEITNLNVTVCGSTTSDWGLVITGHTADIPVTLDSITVQNCSAGISLNSVANTAITAEDTIRGNGHHQIALANVRNITVEDQQFRADEGAFTHAISIGGTATDIAIRNITVTGATKDAIYCGTEGATLSSVTIEDCDIHAPGATGIRNYRSTLDAVTISNVTVDRSGTNGIELADYSSYGRTITGLVLEDVTVTDAGNTGVTISETVAESTAPVLTNITVTGATHTGLFVHAIQRMEITNLNVTVCGSTTSDWGLVITGHTADIPVTLDSITVQNCSAGISLNSVVNTAITAEDTIRGNGHHQIALANVQNITVEDQQFRADEGAFTHAISIGGTATDIAIRNITVTGATKDAIYCGTEGATLSSVTIEDCDIHAPGATGIRNYRSTLDAVTISNVTVDQSGTNGIELADYSSYGRTITGLVLEDVIVTDAGNTGIRVSLTDKSSNGVDLRDITVQESVKTGLTIAAMGPSSLMNVTATACGGDSGDWGVFYTSPGTDLTLDHLTILNCTNGLYLKGGQNAVLGREVTLSGNAGTQIGLDNSENITVRDHAFTNALQAYTYAVRLTGTSDGITLTNITAVSPTYELLDIGGNVANLTAGDLTITTPGRHGIYAEGAISHAVFTNITVTDPVNTGFANYYKYGNIENVTLRNWTITEPGTEGGIKITDSGSYGTLVKECTLERVTVTGSAGPGIQISQNTYSESGDVTITGCRVENNAGIGIQTTWRGKAVFDDLTATGNGGYGLSLTAVTDSAEAPDIGTLSVTGNNGGVSLTGFRDSVITSSQQSVLDNGGRQVNLVDAENLTIRDYAFTNDVQAYEYAVVISGTSDSIQISNITAISPTYELLYNEGATRNLTATDLSIITPGRHGIYAYGSLIDTLFENVTVTNPVNTGFTNYYKYGNIENLTLRNWTVTTPGTEGGIKITDSGPSSYSTPVKKCTLERVTVTGSAGPGIQISQNAYSESGDVTITNATVTNATYGGVELRYRGTVNVSNPTITECGDAGTQAGIFAHGYGTHALSITGADLSNNYYGIRLENTSSAFLNDSLVLESTIGGLYAAADCTGMAAYNLSFNATAPTGMDVVPDGGIVLGDAWSEQTTPYPGTGIYAGVQPLSAASSVNITIPVSGTSDPADLRLFVTHADADWTVLPAPNTATVTGPASADVFAAVTPESLPTAGTWYTLTPLVCATGYINVTSVPEGGWVWLDGTNMSVQTNTRLPDIPIGTHTITVCKKGYPDATNTSVQVLSRETTTVGFTLDNQWEIPLLAGWNMISMPATGTPVTWPADVTTSCYRYDGSSYDKADRDALEPGTGYWIACTAPCTLVIEGAVVPAYTIGGNAGWNLIGATGDVHPTSDITTTPAGLVTGTIYAYNGATYVSATDITPGVGYWAALTGDGTITLG